MKETGGVQNMRKFFQQVGGNNNNKAKQINIINNYKLQRVAKLKLMNKPPKHHLAAISI